MNVLDLKLKDFLKIIIICLGIISILSVLYYLTEGGFFDGIILTFIGLSFTYLILILAVLLFKLVTSFFSNNKMQLLYMGITLIGSIVIGLWLFKYVFKFILRFQE